MPVVPLPNIIKNTTQAAAGMIGHLGPRQTSSRGSGGVGGGTGGTGGPGGSGGAGAGGGGGGAGGGAGGGVPLNGALASSPVNMAPPTQRTNSLRGDREGSRRGQVPVISQPPAEERYVVYIRLPFERNGFVDPPQVDWNDAKERYLWKVLSRAGRSMDIDWNELATDLQVSREFLLQQAAWLYERELSQIQAQMRRAGTSALNTNIANIASSSPYSRPQSPAVMGGAPMARTGTAGTEPRTHSSLSVRSIPIVTPRLTPALPATPTNTNRPSAQPMSRTGSSTTTRGGAQPPLISHRFSNHVPPDPSPSRSPEHPSSASEDYTESSTASASSDDDDDGGNRLFRRLPSFLNKKGSRESSDEDGDEEPAFLPFSPGEKLAAGTDDQMTGTVTLRRRTSGAGTIKGKESVRPSSRTGVDPSLEFQGTVRARRSRIQQPLAPMGSPRRLPVDSTGLSTGPNSPSMGSSFSDLSDASVTQSAMEEAYLSTMQAGGMASRMSNLSQAQGNTPPLLPLQDLDETFSNLDLDSALQPEKKNDQEPGSPESTVSFFSCHQEFEPEEPKGPEEAS
ncbi:uncharacterized protein H6S33_002739 [Morchella sextelata]|uniref:uncharacterized protein n=1 Tax=Morchella sextelata TaxID=1174677 RepID=UPI001D044EA4|nr:uncharacterized protein H6S33_002739 [Morchella sextelata]KAH0607705.1 hypothetical protein H6S33_002739 [Morchella sextelata]